MSYCMGYLMEYRTRYLMGAVTLTVQLSAITGEVR